MKEEIQSMYEQIEKEKKDEQYNLPRSRRILYI